MKQIHHGCWQLPENTGILEKAGDQIAATPDKRCTSKGMKISIAFFQDRKGMKTSHLDVSG
ncbi:MULTISPECIES: hypothetical protein [Heyndrickxia]|uniref:hypothetical protein n=1 Tax=Heyndrickxia TaxID=2837504 RepID=UPI002164634D|nr:hypothetical protein [Heyndrickxia coagulans]